MNVQYAYIRNVALLYKDLISTWYMVGTIGPYDKLTLILNHRSAATIIDLGVSEKCSPYVSTIQ